MILANLRERISATDVELVIQLLSRGDAAHRGDLLRMAGEHGIDSLLDAAELPELLRTAQSLGQPTAALFIYVTVRHALRASGIDDRSLCDYLGALVFEFWLRDRGHRISRCHDLFCIGAGTGGDQHSSHSWTVDKLGADCGWDGDSADPQRIALPTRGN